MRNSKLLANKTSAVYASILRGKIIKSGWFIIQKLLSLSNFKHDGYDVYTFLFYIYVFLIKKVILLVFLLKTYYRYIMTSPKFIKLDNTVIYIIHIKSKLIKNSRIKSLSLSHCLYWKFITYVTWTIDFQYWQWIFEHALYH